MFVVKERLWEPINFRFYGHRRKLILSHFSQDGFYLSNNLNNYSRCLVDLVDIILISFRAFCGPAPQTKTQLLSALISCSCIFTGRPAIREETGFNSYNKHGRQLIRAKKLGLLLQDVADEIMDIIKNDKKRILIDSVAKIEAAEIFLCPYNGFITKLFWNMIRFWTRQPCIYIPNAKIAEWNDIVLDRNTKMLMKYY